MKTDLYKDEKKKLLRFLIFKFCHVLSTEINIKAQELYTNNIIFHAINPFFCALVSL